MQENDQELLDFDLPGGLPDADDEDMGGDGEDDEDEEETPGVDVSKLPTIAKDDETVRRKLEKAKRQPVRPRILLHYGY